MLPIRYTFTPANASTTGYAASVTGATFTLTSTTATDGLAHRVTVLNNTATDHSGKTLTFTGTDVDGFPLVETKAGPAGSATVTTTGYFKTLPTVTISATIGADTFSIGWAAQIQTPTIGLDRYIGRTGFTVNITGTISYTVQQTQNNIQVTDRTSIYWLNNDDTALVAATTSKTGNYFAPIVAMRVLVNSYSSGATLQLNIMQSYV